MPTIGNPDVAFGGVVSLGPSAIGDGLFLAILVMVPGPLVMSVAYDE